MGMIREFREFVVRGNALDMAVGIIVGAAFGKVVSSLVDNILMPPIGLVVGNVDFASLAWTLRPATAESEAVTVGYGLFLNAVVDLVLVALAVFLIVRWMNRLHRKREEVPPAAPTLKDCPRCFSAIPVRASRCPSCTSELGPA